MRVISFLELSFLNFKCTVTTQKIRMSSIGCCISAIATANANHAFQVFISLDFDYQVLQPNKKFKIKNSETTLKNSV